ncbi:MAG: hypothetical protein LBQ81_11840 [Zoogloeaceae bacterium]|jgi:hypothetical protein|nr:hypothetical protein [Zoogloeaceae bacterium]
MNFCKAAPGQTTPCLESAPVIAHGKAPVVAQTLCFLSRERVRGREFAALRAGLMWFAFRRVQPDWTECPAFFFEARPEDCRWGMGYYAVRRGFALEGDEDKSLPLAPTDTPEAITDLTRRRLCGIGWALPDFLCGECACKAPCGLTGTGRQNMETQ